MCKASSTLDRRNFLIGGVAAGSLLSACRTAIPIAGDMPRRPFIDRLGEAPIGGGYRQQGFFVWGGSAVEGEDGRYHLFASRWNVEVGFWSWLTNSQIVRASSDSPLGPFRFEEVVLPERDRTYFDAMMTHNPTILSHEGVYYLFYTGTTYEFEKPKVEGDLTREQYFATRWNQRIGLATSRSVFGPWIRADEPLLEPRPGKWDSLMTTNPAPAIREDGSILLVYKSSNGDQAPLLLGVASAPGPAGPYTRLSDTPIKLRRTPSSSPDASIEDAFVWWNGLNYEMILKDLLGEVSGIDGVGIHATSSDGVVWTASDPLLAYDKTIRWDDGTVTKQANFERPQLLIENGKPTHLYAATGNGVSQFQFEGETWNVAIPLKY